MKNETPGEAVESRPAAPADEPFLRALGGAVVAERLGQVGLNPEELLTIQEIQFIARRRDRAAQYPGADEELIMLGFTIL